MDYSEIIQRRYHPVLRWLGRLPEEWVELRDAGKDNTTVPSEHKAINLEGTGVTSFHSRKQWVSQQIGFEQHKTEFMHLIKLESVLGAGGLAFLDATAAGLARGPKIFCPTAEQFDAMQHVDIDIPIADYRQPFPSLIVRIPPESKKAIAAQAGIDDNNCPSWLLIHNRLTTDGKNYVFILVSYRKDGIDVPIVFQDRPEFASLEQAVLKRILINTHNEAELAQHRFAEMVARSALNLMLMLVHYGCKVGEPLHPKEYKDRRESKKAEHLKHSDFLTIQMTQEIVIRRTEHKRIEGEPTGKEIAPHWRRGHWRHQHYGAKNSQIKMVFIHPILVRADRTVGDLGESQAIYMVK